MPYPPADHTPTPPKVRTIPLNQSIDAIYIPGEVRELYVFATDRAQWVGIEFAPRDALGDLHLVAQVYDASGVAIPKVSTPIGQPTLRDVWDIPGPGTYTIHLYGTETASRAFVLRVFGVPTPTSGGGILTCDETSSGEIAVRGQRDQWVFEGQAGDHMTIIMLAPGKDGVLELYDPKGKLIAQSDDAAPSGTDPAVDIVLPHDGTYTIVARMYGDAYAGVYRLGLACDQ
jgi:hypothetical protein